MSKQNDIIAKLEEQNNVAVSNDIKDVMNDIMESLTPQQLDNLHDRMSWDPVAELRREFPIGSMITYHPPDYDVKFGRVIGYQRMCSENAKILAIESDGILHSIAIWCPELKLVD